MTTLYRKLKEYVAQDQMRREFHEYPSGRASGVGGILLAEKQVFSTSLAALRSGRVGMRDIWRMDLNPRSRLPR